jgi:hypothetical protein
MEDLIEKDESVQDARLTAVEVRLANIEKLLTNHIEHIHKWAICLVGAFVTLSAALLKLLFR